MREVREGDIVSAEYEGKILSGILIGSAKNPDDGKLYVQFVLADLNTFICPADELIDCVFVGDGD